MPSIVSSDYLHLFTRICTTSRPNFADLFLLFLTGSELTKCPGFHHFCSTGVIVEGEVTNGLNIAGTRKFFIYEAAKCFAQYNGNPQDSIFFDEMNLKFSLFFPSSQLSRKFCDTLLELKERAMGSQGADIIQTTLAYRGYWEELSKSVSRKDYNPEDTNSPTTSVRSREQVDMNMWKDVCVYQAIEIEAAIQCGHNSCHILPRALCNTEEAEDPNNRIALTPNGHHMFNAYSQSTHSVPLIRVSVDKVHLIHQEVFSLEKQTVQHRYRVDILIEFANKNAFDWGMNVKDGYIQDENLPLTKKSHVMVLDHHAFCDYVNRKYVNTTQRGFEVQIVSG